MSNILGMIAIPMENPVQAYVGQKNIINQGFDMMVGLCDGLPNFGDFGGGGSYRFTTLR